MITAGGEAPTRRLFTIGHGAGTAEGFVERCRSVAIEAIVDVRTAPGSRRHPHFGRVAMEAWLSEAGVGYRWEPRLGGFRHVHPGSVNTGLRHEAFRGYADHMRTDEFRVALSMVLDEATRAATAVMCSETLWWRCHRRLIADFAALVDAVEVLHVLGASQVEPHRLTPEARLDGRRLRYEAERSRSLPF